jgi:hypothetical protein
MHTSVSMTHDAAGLMMTMRYCMLTVMLVVHVRDDDDDADI